MYAPTNPIIQSSIDIQWSQNLKCQMVSDILQDVIWHMCRMINGILQDTIWHMCQIVNNIIQDTIWHMCQMVNDILYDTIWHMEKYEMSNDKWFQIIVYQCWYNQTVNENWNLNLKTYLSSCLRTIALVSGFWMFGVETHHSFRKIIRWQKIWNTNFSRSDVVSISGKIAMKCAYGRLHSFCSLPLSSPPTKISFHICPPRARRSSRVC